MALDVESIMCENASNHDPTAKLTQRIDFVRNNEISAGVIFALLT